MAKPFTITGPLPFACRTRDGAPARVICTDAKGGYPVVALIEYQDGELTVLRNADGRCYDNRDDTGDLVNIPRSLECWIVWVEYTPGQMACYSYRRRDVAEDNASKAKALGTWFAGPILSSCEEGEGG